MKSTRQMYELVNDPRLGYPRTWIVSVSPALPGTIAVFWTDVPDSPGEVRIDTKRVLTWLLVEYEAVDNSIGQVLIGATGEFDCGPLNVCGYYNLIDHGVSDQSDEIKPRRLLAYLHESEFEKPEFREAAKRFANDELEALNRWCEGRRRVAAQVEHGAPDVAEPKP